ncbi:MAG TPA: efflux RND transporter periplasmic adaptor subunit, partial [Acetobacteraceae bacterium]|nr:efflux RND transporter periplasmic adaptor subunit [Acetobacteraceae bacterium]
MTRVRTGAGLALLLVAVCLAGGLRAEERGVLLRLDDRQVRAAGIETMRVEAEAGTAEITLPGIVAVPPQLVRIVAAPAGGLVESMFVAPDETVRPGQAVARIRSPDFVEAQRLYLEARTATDLNAEKLRRDEELFRDRIIAERRLLVTRAEAQAAVALLQERRQILAIAGMGVDDITRLEQSRQILPVLTVTAPIGGIVIQRHATAGERVPHSAPLMAIADLQALWVNIQVPIGRAAALEAASRVVLPAQGAEGLILRIGRTADPATQSVTAVAEVHGPRGALRPGQAVTVTVQLGTMGGPQWRVPASAVVRHRDRHWVFVRVPEGFRARPVTLLQEGAQTSSIRADFPPGAAVAIRGIVALLG